MTEPTKKKWVMVTGAAGLLGRQVVHSLLAKGEWVRAIYHINLPEITHAQLEFVQADMLDVIALEDAMQDVKQIYHCAGVVSFSKDDKHKLYSINVEGTTNLVNVALVSGIEKMVHVSSVAALGRAGKKAMVTEELHWATEKTNNAYGHSKFLGEMEVWRAMAEGLNAVIINPTIILGKGDWENSSSVLFKNAWNEFPWYTEGASGFTGAEDIAEIMYLLMQSDVTGERFIVNAENLSYKKVQDMMAECFQKKTPNKKVSLFMANMIRYAQKFKSLFSGKSPFITKNTIETAMSVTQYDNSKLLKAIPGFNYMSIDEVIKETCNYFKQKLNNQ